jgi:TetR/AcrR family transcriptional regulator, tetracycline repressor protein
VTRPRRSRGRGERAGLAAADVVAAARDLAGRGGIEAISMRRLADELGVTANALYTYFPDKSSLLDALLDDLLGGIATPDGRSGWQEPLVAILRDTRRVLLAHRDLIPLYLARPGRGANAMRLGDAMLESLARGGVGGRAAADALRILLIFTLGFAAHEAPRRSDPAGPARIRASEAAFRGADERPRLRHLAGELARHPDDETFERGLRWLLSGIAGDAAGRRTARGRAR